MLLNKRISIIYFIKEIQFQIITICLFSMAVGWLDNYQLLKEVSFPIGVPTMIGTAVSLLLAFRISQSYERWWEARIIWGAIVNDSRTLIRQAIQFTNEDAKSEIQSFATRQIIWNYALGESLRKTPFTDKVQQYLVEHDVAAANIPNALLDKHSEQIKKWAETGVITEFRQIQLDTTLARLCDSMGKCERVKNTIFPRSYSVLVHTLIYTFAFILPFGLDDAHVIAEILMTIIIPVMFIAIEKTAIIMQDPFENTPVDTPMTALATTIEINIRQMIGDKNIPEKPVNTTYYEL